jgi:hypothetical protein
MKLLKFFSFLIMIILVRLIRIKLNTSPSPDDDYVNPNQGVCIINSEH